MSNQELKEGDVVQLKSGGVSMTISKIENSEARCYWMNGNEIRTERIPLVALRRRTRTTGMM